MRCVIIAFFLTCVSFAQTDIEIIQFSASFVKDKEISLKGFKYDTKTGQRDFGFNKGGGVCRGQGRVSRKRDFKIY
jgi:hypothetical protein